MVEFEHTLFMLLLLVGIFSAKPPQQKLALVFIVGGTLLALLPPFVRISISWEWILNLTLPLLFWQNARHWLHARWRIGSAELALWLLSIAGLTVALGVAGYLTWAAALLFGIVAASMLWRAIESEQSFSHLSQLGPLTLLFLLTEIAPVTWGVYSVGLRSGLPWPSYRSISVGDYCHKPEAGSPWGRFIWLIGLEVSLAFQQ